MPNRWAHDIKHVSKDEIVQYCVNDKEWQKFRLSLKGTSTRVKLEQLEHWRATHQDRRGEVQVDNYLNALKRGGQLDLEGNITR